MLSLTFPEKGFKFVIQKSAKNWGMLFSNVYNIDFWGQGMKNIFYDTSFDQIFIQVLFNAFPHFARKWFHFGHWIICQNLKNEAFKHIQHSFWSLRYLQNHFSRNFVWANFDLNSFERFASLSLKVISTWSCRNLQKTVKCPFQRLTTFVFEVKVASNTFSKKLLMSNFLFKYIWALCLTFPGNGLTLVTEKFVKIWKTKLSTTHNFSFWAKGTLETIF